MLAVRSLYATLRSVLTCSLLKQLRPCIHMARCACSCLWTAWIKRRPCYRSKLWIAPVSASLRSRLRGRLRDYTERAQRLVAPASLHTGKSKEHWSLKRCLSILRVRRSLRTDFRRRCPLLVTCDYEKGSWSVLMGPRRRTCTVQGPQD